jgi:hypothetical protein
VFPVVLIEASFSRLGYRIVGATDRETIAEIGDALSMNLFAGRFYFARLLTKNHPHRSSAEQSAQKPPANPRAVSSLFGRRVYSAGG